MTLRAAIIGAVESTAVAIRAFAGSDWNLALVVTLPPEKSGRHSDYVDLQSEATKVGAPVFHTSQTNSPLTLAAIREAKPDFIFVVGWSQICGPDFLSVTPGRVIGYHPAALPRLRGRAAIPWTILLDEKISAGSLFQMAEGVDDGPLLDQHFCHIAPRETAMSLYEKHMSALAIMMRRALTRLSEGNTDFLKQDESCATYAVRRTPADGLINWHQPAREIDRLIRATGRPYPGAYTFANRKRLTIWASELVEPALPFHAMPGQLVANDSIGLLLQTGSGQIRVTDWTWDSDGQLPMHGIWGRNDE